MDSLLKKFWMEEYIGIFEEEGITLEILPSLKAEPRFLETLIPKMGHRLLFLKQLTEYLQAEEDINVVYLTSAEYLNLSQKIVDLFPSEIKELYYVPPVRKRDSILNKNGLPKGKLVDKFKNKLTFLRDAGILAARDKEVKQDPVEIPTNEEDLLWLRHNREPLEEVYLHWDKLFTNRRQKFMKEGGDLAESFSEFPILKDPIGLRLIERVFERIFNNKSNNIYSEWESATNKLINLRKQYITQDSDKLLIDLLDSENLQEGYILQYLSCFRRERGFCYMYMSTNKTLRAEYQAIFHETCEASVMFSFVLPSLLHFIAYFHLVVIFRNTEDEQLPILMERVFLASTNISNGFISQRRLVRTLRLFFTFSLIWITLSFTVVNLMMVNGDVFFKWMKYSSLNFKLFLKIVLASSTLWHDLIQCTIISNYCLQAQLLRSYVRFMREKLLQFPVVPVEWMRDIEDFKKLLYYFNKNISPSVSLMTVRTLSFALSGTIWIISYDLFNKETLPIFGYSVLNIALWAIIALAPFVQAARLSNSCEVLKSVGQEARARPYVHQATPTLELDSVMLYTTSLKINAQLFYVPITRKMLFFFITMIAVVLLTLGQCHYFIPK